MVTIDQGGASRHRLRIRRPTPDVESIVELSWIETFDHPPPEEPWRIVPDAHPHLIHHRTRDGRTHTVLVGSRSRWVDISRRDRAFTVGVRLSPGAVPGLAGVDAWELRDGAIAADLLAGLRFSAVAGRVAEEDDPAHVEAILLELLRRRPEPRRVDWRVRGMAAWVADPRLRSAGSAPGRVQRVAAVLGVSTRSLRDVCRREVGLRPKEVHRILRLHAAVEAGIAGTPDALAARRAGYADQSHLIRECRELLGDTPAGFRARADSSNTRGRAPE